MVSRVFRKNRGKYWCTDLLQATKNLHLVQEALGHEDLEAIQIYTQSLKEELKDITAEIDIDLIETMGVMWKTNALMKLGVIWRVIEMTELSRNIIDHPVHQRLVEL